MGEVMTTGRGGNAAPTGRGGPALEIVGLRKAFGDTVAVDDVDLIVPRGSFFGLVGPPSGVADARSDRGAADGDPPAVACMLLRDPRPRGVRRSHKETRTMSDELNELRSTGGRN